MFSTWMNSWDIEPLNSIVLTDSSQDRKLRLVREPVERGTTPPLSLNSDGEERAHQNIERLRQHLDVDVNLW